MKNLCIIPARGGSKRIPKKNIKTFYGKPIISYSINTAKKSNIFDEIMVSTDYKEIAEISQKHGAIVPFYRSKNNADDQSDIADVVLEVINEYKKRKRKFDTVCLLLPTAPLIKMTNLNIALKRLKKENCDCVITTAEYSFPIQRSLKIENGYLTMNWPENMFKRSQDLIKTYHDAGQFYFFKTEEFLRQKRLYMEKTAPIILSNLEVQDIDTETDWKLAEMKYKLLYNK